MITLAMIMALLMVGLITGHRSASGSVQPGGTQMLGTVERFADNSVVLADGSSFGVTEQTRVTLLMPATAANLLPGDYVAISAARAMDGALEASVVAAFPAAARGTGEGQREMIETRHCQPLCQPRDLMTNATIDDARVDAMAGGELTISFLGQSELVRVSPLTRVEIQVPGSLADVTPGATLIGFVNDATGMAGVIWIFGS